ncbi:MAG: LTA synthase family protein [Oscillospiraceae bacterium]
MGNLALGKRLHCKKLLHYILLTIPVLALIVLGLVYNRYFFYSLEEGNSTAGFHATTYSDSIQRNKPARVYFTPQEGNLKYIGLRFVAQSELAAQFPITFTLYDEEGAVLQQQQLPQTIFEKTKLYLQIPLEAGLAKGKEYSFTLTSNAGNNKQGYRIAMGHATHSDITQWQIGDKLQGYTADMQFIYPRINWMFTIAYIVCVLLTAAAVFVPPLRSHRSKIIYHCILMFTAPLPVLYVTEWMNGGSLAGLSFWALLLNYFIMVTIVLILYAFCNRFAVATITGAAALIAASTVNYFVLQFRKSVIVPTDIYGIGTATQVSSNYKLSFSGVLLMAVALLLTIVFLSLRDRVVFRGLRFRVVSAAMAMLCTGSVVFFALNPAILASKQIGSGNYSQNFASIKNGFFANFLVNLPSLNIVKPSGYSVSTVKNLAPQAQEAQTDVKPHIIMIMNESLADFSTVGSTHASRDPLSFIHSLKEEDKPNVYVGGMQVSIHGGNTSTTEFETLTGFSVGFENRTVAPLSQYVFSSIPALPGQLSQLGYSTLGTHPNEADNWNRNSAYPKMGFKNMCFIQDYPATECVRNYISDLDMYKFMISLFEEERSQGPVFQFGLTMQNHGWYDWKPEEGEEWPEIFKDRITINNAEGIYPDVEQYLTLAEMSDKAFEELIAYYQTVNEPVIVVMYGDHWPSVDTKYIESLYQKPMEELTPEENMMMYQTPLIMWANYDVDFSGIPDLISANYLMPTIKQAANLPLTSFDTAVLQCREEYPVISARGVLDAKGNYYEDLREMCNLPLLKTYDLMEYNGLFDTHGRQRGLFGYYS